MIMINILDQHKVFWNIWEIKTFLYYIVVKNRIPNRDFRQKKKKKKLVGSVVLMRNKKNTITILIVTYQLPRLFNLF